MKSVDSHHLSNMGGVKVDALAELLPLGALDEEDAIPNQTMTLVVVADGLRPSAIESDSMPFLYRLSKRATTYAQAFAAVPTLTRTNAASLTTGCLPDRTGIWGNRVWHPELGPVDTGHPDDVRRLRDQGAMQQLSVVERLHQDGYSTLVVGNGSGGCTYLLNPGTDAGHGMAIASVDPTGTVFYSMPSDVRKSLDSLGAPPEGAFESLAWAAEAAAVTIKAVDPDLVIFWSGQPDTEHHESGPSSANSREALQRVDAAVQKVYEATVATGRGCNLLVTADHGFCESPESIDLDQSVGQIAAEAGLAEGEFVAAYNSGVVLVYLDNSVSAPVHKAFAQALAQAPWAGPVFCEDGLCPENAFPRSMISRHENQFIPDLIITGRTNATVESRAPATASHLRGHGTKAYRGAHGTLHPEDIQIPLILAGPAFHRSARVSLPARMVDIAPTVFAVMTGKPLDDVDGRILTEAIAEPADWMKSPEVASTSTRQRGSHQIFLSRIGMQDQITGAVIRDRAPLVSQTGPMAGGH